MKTLQGLYAHNAAPSSPAISGTEVAPAAPLMRQEDQPEAEAAPASEAAGEGIKILFKLMDQEAMLPAGLLNDVKTGIMLADAMAVDMPLLYVSPGVEKMTGYSAAELRGRNCRFLQGSERAQPQIETMRDAVSSGNACKVTVKNFHKDGTGFWNEITLLPLFDEQNTLKFYASICNDVTNYVEALILAGKRTFIDEMTGLLNREGALAELTKLLAARRRGELAVATFHIDGLRDINNTFGEEAGDSIIRLAAYRLEALKTLPLLARLSSGRFLAVIQAADGAAALKTVQSALAALQEPYMGFAATLDLPVTCGYTLLERRPLTAAVLMREASIASAMARTEGPAAVSQFTRDADAAVKSRLRMISEIQGAIRNDEFVMHYQPKVEIASGRIVGAEALVRWRHPLFGLQPPGRFLPLIEKSHLIVDIGRLTLLQSASFAARLNANRSGEAISVAVNISPIHFKRENFAAELRDMLAEHGCRPEWISLELVENVLAEITPATINTFLQLRDMGIGIAVDDFGVGYSNIVYLRDLPISEVKIDRTFIQNIDSRPRNTSIVKALNHLAGEFGLCVVAEGVETKAEHDCIRALQCAIGQGFYYSMPLAGSDFEWLLEKHGNLPVKIQDRDG